jgi:glycosyltransferase involved in cell wall biosynthesis
VTDQRIQRMIGTLQKGEVEILLIGRRLPNSLPMQKTSYAYRRMRMVFTKGPLFYVFFNIRLFFLLLFRKQQDLFISNDLDTLLANYLVSRIRKTPLLYDSHEYFTEVPELTNRRRTKKIWEWIEQWILPRVKHAITVSDSIAKTYKEKYGTPFSVVRNVSYSRSPVLDPAFHDRYSARYKVIYQGALNVGRGLELMIQSMRYLSDTLFIIVGDGDIRLELQKMVQDMKLLDKVVFPGKLPPGTLHKITSNCDLGVSMEEDLGLNYRMALPNKIFDYIQARIPVICSDLPEMKALIDTFDIGEVVLSRETKGIASQIQSILNNEQRRKHWTGNLEKAAADLCWEKEEVKLIQLMETIW